MLAKVWTCAVVGLEGELVQIFNTPTLDWPSQTSSMIDILFVTQISRP